VYISLGEGLCCAGVSLVFLAVVLAGLCHVSIPFIPSMCIRAQTLSMPNAKSLFSMDSNDCFHELSHDLNYLERWVDDMIRATISTGSTGPLRAGSLDHYKEQGRRYNICFRELIRKTAINQPEVAK